MQSQSEATLSGNGASTAHDLFVLTDEQILEIEPDPVISSEAGNLSSSSRATAAGQAQSKRDSSVVSLPRNDGAGQGALDTAATGHQSPATSHELSDTNHDSPEPPQWLAAQMRDPWSGEEARELWNGVQQARSEAAAYRAAFATPEDARALKELYPGGVNEARAAASRAHLLDDIDRSYFGTAGKSAEETSAARTQLATMMLREDPAAFREMVFAGLRALEEAEKGSSASAATSNLPRLAQVLATNRLSEPSTVRATLGAPAADDGNARTGGASPAPTIASAATREANTAAYAAFEKAANEDLERSVGASIARTIEQALPNIGRVSQDASGRAGQAPPLHDRLGAAVRQDVEAALKGDRQLGEQIAQILSARRFDNETRAQVVRLIDDRARQLVPSAARRVLGDWTQTTLAAHRGNTARMDAPSARREVEPASSYSGRTSLAANSARNSQPRTGTDPNRGALRPNSQRVDYRKLSDEQILEL